MGDVSLNRPVKAEPTAGGIAKVHSICQFV
jgi:hypothetical protein